MCEEDNSTVDRSRVQLNVILVDCACQVSVDCGVSYTCNTKEAIERITVLLWHKNISPLVHMEITRSKCLALSINHVSLVVHTSECAAPMTLLLIIMREGEIEYFAGDTDVYARQ